MPKLHEVSRVRSKNAGPFWITVDIFFHTPDAYDAYKNSPALGGEMFGRLFGVDVSLVRHHPVDRLRMVKISYPRPKPQGWYGERDMHGGQQFVRLLDLDLNSSGKRD
jgi:Domain of unknown function (DUF4387)